MDKFIESELHNRIFLDPEFINRFLPGNRTKLDLVHKLCQAQDDYYSGNGQWQLPLPPIQDETLLYAPILHMLNTIKSAVDEINTSSLATPPGSSPAPTNLANPDSNQTNQGSTGSERRNSPPSSDHDSSGTYVPGLSPPTDASVSQPLPTDASTGRPLFCNTSRYAIPSDQAETRFLKPDITLFEDIGPEMHLEHVRMPVEIKAKPSHHKVAIKQGARYARAILAHQLHRDHLYVLIVCGTEATFVRFDRAGILYSRRINLLTESEAFTRAFASLLMLDETDHGYNPIFTVKLNNGRLKYYLDLPVSAFATHPSSDISTFNGAAQTHQFLVVDILCYRMGICTRATRVLRIRRIGDDGDEEQGDEYILKIMWRDPARGLEGDILQKVKGKFGLPEYIWHEDASGKCQCSPEVDGLWQCKNCVAKTAQINKLEVCNNLTDLAIEVPLKEEEGDEDPELAEVDTSTYRLTSSSEKRQHRICTFILVSSKGIPLERADSPRQFIQAVSDAFLGYWGLYNLGYLHRDVSDGNVLMLESAQQSEWKSSDLNHAVSTDKVLAKSEDLLRETLKQLGGRGPTGMLSDFDLHAEHSSSSRGLSTMDETNAGSTNTAQENLLVAIAAHSPTPSDSSPVHTLGLVRPRQEGIEDMREPKRRRVISHSGEMGVDALVNPERTHPSGHGYGLNRAIDFRTGTPTFMSTRVTEVPAGEKHYHSFLDDIESFFWVVFWSAAAHLDDEVEHPTASAQDTLDSLNDSNPCLMAAYKQARLTDCAFDIPMRKQLQTFGNSWASDPMFVDVILNFGKLAFEYLADIKMGKNPSPVDVFPAVARVFLNALSKNG